MSDIFSWLHRASVVTNTLLSNQCTQYMNYIIVKNTLKL